MVYELFYRYLFWCSNCSRFGQWEPLQYGLHVLLTCLHHSFYYFFFWSTSLLSGTARCLRVMLYFLWPNPGTQTLLQRILVLLSGGWYLETKIWEILVCHHRAHPSFLSSYICNAFFFDRKLALIILLKKQDNRLQMESLMLNPTLPNWGLT